MKRTCLAASAAAFILSAALAIAPLTASAASSSQLDPSSTDIKVEKLTSRSPYSIPRSASYVDQNAGIALLSDSLPAKYDLRELGLSTPVKDQNVFNTCWAFSAIASFESALIKQRNLDAKDVDLSEMQVAYFLNWRMDADDAQAMGAPGQAGEGIEIKLQDDSSPDEGDGYQTRLETGGDAVMAMSVLSRRTGVVDESVAPYANRERTLVKDPEPVEGWDGTMFTPSEWDPDGDWSLDKGLVGSSKYQLQEMGFGYVTSLTDESGQDIADASYVDTMKRCLMDNGALALSLAVAVGGGKDGVDGYINTKTAGRFVNMDFPANHMATVVGWDDSYSRSNFLSEPPFDGAWIVKNSYGSVDSPEGNVNTWGIDGDGYFYLSYYDATIEDYSWFSPVAEDREAPITLQYDLLGYASGDLFKFYSSEKMLSANVFTTPEDMELTAVSAVSMDSGANVSARIYLLEDGFTDPEDGTLIATAEKALEGRAYSRIDLAAPVAIKKGTKFSVVEEICTPPTEHFAGGEGTQWNVPIETSPIDGESFSIPNAHTYAVSNPGESYILEKGVWEDAHSLNENQDLKDTNVKVGNVMIKAFAKPALIQDDEGGEGGNDQPGGSDDPGSEIGGGGTSDDQTGQGGGQNSGQNTGQSSGLRHPLGSNSTGSPSSSQTGSYGTPELSASASQGASSGSKGSDPKLAQTGDHTVLALLMLAVVGTSASSVLLVLGIRRERQ